MQIVEKYLTSHKLKNPLMVAGLVAILSVGFYVVFENYFFSSDSQSVSPDTPSHEELVDFALSLINSDRQANGLQNVTLSNVNSGQQHAEEMLAHGYFSHWDTNGYKPYIRYTIAGGKGAVSENIGLVENWSSAGISQVQALNESEWGMMYDDAAWNWEQLSSMFRAYALEKGRNYRFNLRTDSWIK